MYVITSMPLKIGRRNAKCGVKNTIAAILKLLHMEHRQKTPVHNVIVPHIKSWESVLNHR